MGAKVTPADYYELNPTADDRTGDIWSGLPTIGLLREPVTRALVITPACDLANCKAETITYLPIVPVSQFLTLPAFVPEIARSLKGQLQKLGIDLGLEIQDQSTPIRSATVDGAIDRLAEITKPGTSRGDPQTIDRVSAGLRLLRLSASSRPSSALPGDVKLLLGEKHWGELRGKIVRNAFRADIHFLPGDGQRPEWTGVSAHSVALFRYPITVPLTVLEAAKDSRLTDWPAALRSLELAESIAQSFHQERPLKRTTLRPVFLSDLLTRYVGLYVRLGSPDFSPGTIEAYVEDLE